MSRTLRKYNVLGNYVGVYRKYGYVCMGRCPRCKRNQKNLSKDRRMRNKKDLLYMKKGWKNAGI